MSRRTRNQSMYFIFALQIFRQISQIACGPQIGTTANVAHHRAIIPATIIERTEPLGNGCFKQTIKEPDQSDLSRFIFTEQLICPPGVNMTAMTQQYQKPNLMPIVPALTHQPTLVFIQPTNITNGSVASTNVPVYKPPAVLPVPVNATPIAVLPPPSQPTAPLPAVLTQQKYQPDVFKPPQPVMVEIPNVAPSQVVVLSKKTGHYNNDRKTNSATTLIDLKAFVILSLLTLLANCFI